MGVREQAGKAFLSEVTFHQRLIWPGQVSLHSHTILPTAEWELGRDANVSVEAKHDSDQAKHESAGC
jgi:hypothetical protein